MSLKCKMANGDTGLSVFWCAFVSNTKISVFVVTLWLVKTILKGLRLAYSNSPALAWEKRKTMAVLKYFLCISSSYNLTNSRVPQNRQTENLGDFGVFQTSWMRTFQILRFAEIEINPCNSTSKHGTKKAEWRVSIRHQDKKMVADLKKK